MRLFPLTLALVILAGGCGTVPFVEEGQGETPVGWSASDLRNEAWTSRSDSVLLRQTAVFDWRGRKVPMRGMMRFDMMGNTMRLAAVNDLGIKLFDIEVTEKTWRKHYILGELEEIPRFLDVVATSLRKIFIFPRIGSGEKAVEKRGFYLLKRTYGETMLSSYFGGEIPRLMELKAVSPSENWKVRYYGYPATAQKPLPRNVVLEDRDTGYSLTLTLERVSE